MDSGIIALNIGGTVFKTYKATLQKFPNSKLGRLTPNSKNYLSLSKEYFFDRSPQLFDMILEFYRSDDLNLHVPSYICGSVLKRELEYWEIPVQNISNCCFRTYTNYENEEEVRRNINTSYEQNNLQLHQTKAQYFQHQAFIFFDNPRSSRGAMIFFIVFMIMVSMSVIMSCLVTDKTFRESILVDKSILNSTKSVVTSNYSQPRPGNSVPLPPTTLDSRRMLEDKLSWKIRLFIHTKPVDALINIDAITSAFFALELLIHFCLSPQKKRFLRDSNNKIDIFLFIFTITSYVVYALAKEFMIYESYRVMFVVANVTIMFKLLRFFRLTKVYTELHILFLAFKASAKELLLLFVTFGIFAVVYGNLIYYSELTEEDTFPNMFIGIWWAVVTMTTVGYGDTVPKSVVGYVTGVITSMSGLLIIAMPVAIIARNFDGYYNVHNDKISKRKKSLPNCRHQAAVSPIDKEMFTQNLMK